MYSFVNKHSRWKKKKERDMTSDFRLEEKETFEAFKTGCNFNG